MSAATYRTQRLDATPTGWKVRSKRVDSHVLRIGFPPGKRKRGSGRVLEILHPKKNPSCEEGTCQLSQKNPTELLIFGNPTKAPVYKKPVTQITDRAKRYRANHPAVRPAGPRVCEYCGRRNNDESNFSRRNLAYACRSCNVIIGLEHKANGKGKRVSQMNPEGAKTMAQWVSAVLSMKGESDAIPKNEAIEIIRATPASARSKFADEIWRRRGRRNPEASETQQAIKLFKSFHGKDARGVIEAQRSGAIRLDYTALGDLVALGLDDCGFSDSKLTSHWDQCPNVGFQGDKVKLASSPNGRQLYLIEGNQNLDSGLSSFEEVDTQKDLLDLGDVYFVVYNACKVHSNFEPTEWVHRFGEKNNILPRLVYDKLKKECALVGGEYFINSKNGVSPGIEG